MSEPPRVTIAGAGIAGMAAALRLAERGYRVTIHEQKTMLGGNLGSREGADGVPLDIYPHMYLSWYRNFWRLFADVGGEQDRQFLALSTVKQLDQGAFPHFASVTNMYSPWRMIPNLFAGIGPPADMFVFGYGALDLLAERLHPTVRLPDMSVSGFLNGRPYMTARAAAAFDSFITRVWAVPGYLASAEDFQEYLRYSLADPTPAFWLPRGPALRQVIGPLVARLRELGVRIVSGVQAVGVVCDKGRVTDVVLQDSKPAPPWTGIRRTQRTEPVDELVLAVPAMTLSQLIRRDGGAGGHSIVEAAPRIAGIARLRAQQIPLLYLYFNRRLPGVPLEPVGLFGSELCLAFTDISQLWEDGPGGGERTVLAVSSSDPNGLPNISDRDDTRVMLQELARYLPFDPGTSRRRSPDVDWDRTRYETNADSLLFINETGTDKWRPTVWNDDIPNLTFAGDFCHSHIGMTTIESAVTTGLQAAQSIVERRGVGRPVEVLRAPTSPLVDLASVWSRYGLAPYLWSAVAWSRGSDAMRGAARAGAALWRMLTPSA